MVFRVVSYMQVLLPKSRKHFCYPTSHFPHPPSTSDYLNNIWRGGQITKLHITHFPAVTCYSLPLRIRHLPQHTIGKEISVQICWCVSRNPAVWQMLRHVPDMHSTCTGCDKSQRCRWTPIWRKKELHDKNFALPTLAITLRTEGEVMATCITPPSGQATTILHQKRYARPKCLKHWMGSSRCNTR